MPQKLTVGLYQANPSLPDGSIQFNKSQTGTNYQRYNAIFDGANGPQNCLLFLNAELVSSQAIIPQNLEGMDIYVPDVDFRVSMENQQPDALAAGQPRLVFTQFNVDMDDDLKASLVNRSVQMQIAATQRLSQDIAKKKMLYRKQLLTGQVTSSLDPRLQNRGGVGTFQDQGTINNPDTNEGNRAKPIGSNEATAQEIGGGKGITTPDGGDGTTADVHTEALENAGEENPS